MKPTIEANGFVARYEALASGFYGTGSIACWYLLAISWVLSWSYKASHRYRVVYELIAVVAYAVIAGGHLLFQTIHFPSPKTQYLSNNLANILFPNVKGPVSAEIGSPVYLPDNSTDRQKLFPQVASINAALRIVDSYTHQCIIALIFVLIAQYSSAKQGAKKASLRNRPAIVVLCASLVWTWTVELVLYVKLCTFGRYGLLPFLYSLIHYSIFPIYIGLAFPALVLTVVPTMSGIMCLIQAARIARGEGRDTMLRLACDMFGYVFMWAFLYTFMGALLYVVYLIFPTRLLFPDVGVSITRLDQATALVAGVFLLSMNIRGILIAKVRASSQK
ncbi:hypothetical protein V2G26_003823 [Clonostachys chloroleuca]